MPDNVTLQSWLFDKQMYNRLLVLDPNKNNLLHWIVKERCNGNKCIGLIKALVYIISCENEKKYALFGHLQKRNIDLKNALVEFNPEPLDSDLLYILLNIFNKSQDTNTKNKIDFILKKTYEPILENFRRDPTKYAHIWKLLIKGCSEDTLIDVCNKLILNETVDQGVKIVATMPMVKPVEYSIGTIIGSIVAAQERNGRFEIDFETVEESHSVRWLYFTAIVQFLNRLKKLPKEKSFKKVREQKKIRIIFDTLLDRTRQKANLFSPLVISLNEIIEPLKDPIKYPVLYNTLKYCDNNPEDIRQQIIFFAFSKPDLTKLKLLLIEIDPNDPLIVILANTWLRVSILPNSI